MLGALTHVSVDRAQATEWLVPHDGRQISLIIPSTSNGDTISVVNATAAIQRPIFVSKSLLIRNTTGDTITILSDTDSMAVDVGSSGVVIDGGTGKFRITGATGPASVVDLFNATMRNCAIEDSGHAYTSDAVVHIDGGGTLTDCSVTLTSTTSARAIQIETTNGAGVSDCVISCDQDGSTGNVETISVAASGVTISNNTIQFTDPGTNALAIQNLSGTSSFFEDNLILGAHDGISLNGSSHEVNRNAIDIPGGGEGIHVSSSSTGDFENNTVFADTTCVVGAIGMYFANSGGSSTVNNNLFYNVDYGIYYGAGTTDNLSHNIFWGACGDSSNRSLSASQILKAEPLFCGGQEGTERFTQRIDSPAVPGVNDWGELVGARDIECAWGTLARNTTVPKTHTIKVLKDVTVSAGKSLTVEHDVSFLFDEDDDSAGGSDAALNELIVYGVLTATGKADSLIDFVSNDVSPGENDWRGIDVKSGGVAHLKYGRVMNATYGMIIGAVDTASVRNSLFESNGTVDIQMGGGGVDLPVDIGFNTINVDGGDGIVVHDDGGNFGGIIHGNTINGTSASSNGIYIGDSIGDASPVITDNEIDGFTAGAAIRSDKSGSDPILTENRLTDSKWGGYFSNGNPTVGDPGDSGSDNICTGNSTSGLYFTGSSTTGVVRQSQFTGNGTGIITKGNANPDLGSAADGNNILVTNTTYCLWNQSSSGTVSAQGNYIGGCSPPPGICWNGSFDLSSALCSPPSARPTEVGPVPPFQLLGPRPNPLTASTVIHFSVGVDDARVGVLIFDVSGRLVRNLGERKYVFGDHSVTWDGANGNGRSVSNGLYFIRATVNDVSARTTKILVTR